MDIFYTRDLLKISKVTEALCVCIYTQHICRKVYFHFVLNSVTLSLIY